MRKSYAPWMPAEYKPADARAIRACALGEATEAQQRRAMDFIVNEICKTYDLSYRPESDRDTVLAEGKRYVGLQIVKFINGVALGTENG